MPGSGSGHPLRQTARERPVVITYSSLDIDELASHLRQRVVDFGGRQIIGVIGAPGTGKSTVAQLVAERLGSDAVVVPMDGFHLSNALLEGTPLRQRKGAIDTFDGGGYHSLLKRLRLRDEAVVYAPGYRRGLEEPIAASIAVPREVDIILTEGNYLLADAPPWDAVRAELDESWFVDTPDEVRVARLVNRHIAFGMDRAAAEAWAAGPDARNAELVMSTRKKADRIIPWT